MSRWSLASPFRYVQSHPSIIRVIQSLPPCAQPGQPHNWHTTPKERTSQGTWQRRRFPLGVTVRGVVTTTLMVTQVATPIPCVPLGLLRVSLQCSRDLLCCLHASSPVSVRWSSEAVARLSHPIKLQCKTFTRI
jgi:hypothetical protein